MSYAKVDALQYKVMWTDFINPDVDITPYIISHDSNEGLLLENSTISLTLKLLKNKRILNGTDNAPFFTDNIGVSRLKTDSALMFYLKYVDGDTTEITTKGNLVKTYYITDWDVTEPDNKITISAVDLAYKVTNRVISKQYRTIESSTSMGTVTASGTTTFTDTAASFEVPGVSDTYEDGYKWFTLELVDNTGVQYFYLITNNTATTCTTHKAIVSGKTWSSYRIGHSSPSAIFDVINKVARAENGQGEAWRNINADRVITTRDDYKGGIQFLRRDGSTTWAFPIVDIGEAFMPVYKLIKEVSSFTACNTEDEMIDATYPIQRDMIFNIVWNNDTDQSDVDWFYLDSPVQGSELTISAVGTDSLTVSSASSDDVGQLLRVTGLRSGQSYSKSYTITDVTGSVMTLDGNPTADGVTTSDTCRVYGAIDFVWDSHDDFKHIYSIKMGSQDEEKWNNIMFNAGTNQVAERDILGHWFNEQTESDTLKETFIPMTSIGKKMMKYELDNSHIRLNSDTWEGWTGAAWTATPASWNFTTTFGTDIPYTCNSRSAFNVNFKTAARKQAYRISQALALQQKENTLKGTFVTRGQRFISLTATGDEKTKWYQKGTRILFRKPDAGLNNKGDRYYTMVVTKIRHRIDSTRWTTSMDVEYDSYDVENLIKGDY